MRNLIDTFSIFSIIFTISFMCWIVFELWVFSRDRSLKMNSSRDQGSDKWVITMLMIGILLGFNIPNIAPQFSIQNYSVEIFFLGIIFIYSGILFRFWAIQTLGKFFRTKIVIQEEHRLIMSGPYKYLRNPSYTGTLVTLIGFGLGIGNWLSALALFAAGIAAYTWRIKVEEKALREQFGQAFEDYRKETWALIPFIW